MESNFADENLAEDHPLLKHPIAKVKKILGPEAFLISRKTPELKKPLREGSEIRLGDQIVTGRDSQVEISLIERELLFKDTIEPKNLKYSSMNFLRLGSETKGSLKYFPLVKEDSPLLVFVVEQGKLLVHLDLQEYQIATRTPLIDCRPWGDIYLVESSEKGSWVGVLSGAVDITLRQKKSSTWVVHLIRGEQLLPYQIGALNINLDTEQLTDNNYPINQIRKTEPLITKFNPFPAVSQKALSVWGDRQEYRFSDYVRTRNEQRRDLKRSIERMTSPKSSNTIQVVSPSTEISSGPF